MITNSDILIDSCQFNHLSNDQLGQVIFKWRQYYNWTQYALACSAGVSEKTIKRIERGHGCETRTRRSIAQAFGFEDSETFNKPYPLFDSKYYQKMLRQLEQSHNHYPLDDIARGWELVNKLDAVDSCHKRCADLEDQSNSAFIRLSELIQDYLLSQDDMTLSLKNKRAQDLDDVISELKESDIMLKGIIRHLRLEIPTEYTQTPGDYIVMHELYLYLGNKDALPQSLWFPKQVHNELE